MGVTVRIPAALRALVGGRAELAAPAGRLRDVLEAVGRESPELVERVLTRRGARCGATSTSSSTRRTCASASFSTRRCARATASPSCRRSPGVAECDGGSKPIRTLEPAVLPTAVLNEIFAHAREADPEECCGLILGTAQARYQRVVRCRNDMTAWHQRDPETYPRDGTQGFYMSELDYLRAEEEARARGERDHLRLSLPRRMRRLLLGDGPGLRAPGVVPVSRRGSSRRGGDRWQGGGPVAVPARAGRRSFRRVARCCTVVHEARATPTHRSQPPWLLATGCAGGSGAVDLKLLPEFARRAALPRRVARDGARQCDPRSREAQQALRPGGHGRARRDARRHLRRHARRRSASWPRRRAIRALRSARARSEGGARACRLAPSRSRGRPIAASCCSRVASATALQLFVWDRATELFEIVSSGPDNHPMGCLGPGGRVVASRRGASTGNYEVRTARDAAGLVRGSSPGDARARPTCSRPARRTRRWSRT